MSTQAAGQEQEQEEGTGGETEKQSIRIPTRKWKAAVAKGKRIKISAAFVVNEELDRFLNESDDESCQRLTGQTFKERLAERATRQQRS